MSGDYLKIWRPRRFGKTLVCDMLAEYYDASNSADQVILLSVEHSKLPSIL
jgi:UDP-N-acetylmuramate-alanine ligase